MARLILAFERNDGTLIEHAYSLTDAEGARVETAAARRVQEDQGDMADPDAPTLAEAVKHMADGTAAGILANVVRTEQQAAAETAAAAVAPIVPVST